MPIAPLYAPLKTGPCSGCGAVAAPLHGNKYELCENCWNQVQMSAGNRLDLRREDQEECNLEEAVTLWLAAKIVRDVNRARNGLPLERCEAVSNWSEGRPGTQCANRATGYRQSRAVCTLHHRAINPVFVGERQSDYYQVMKGLLTDLANADEKFAEVIREVADA